MTRICFICRRKLYFWVRKHHIVDYHQFYVCHHCYLYEEIKWGYYKQAKTERPAMITITIPTSSAPLPDASS